MVRTLKSANRLAKSAASRSLAVARKTWPPAKSDLDARLQAYTQRPFETQPPTDADTMATLGVSAQNLDAFVRVYVNRVFGKGHALYKKGKLTPDVTYKDLRTKCGV